MKGKASTETFMYTINGFPDSSLGTSSEIYVEF